ncbi:N,N-dimethylformamidase beta subunit family domain-containing protein [Micromonospora sp. NPDC049366]|uniref:N,N-dimethylformamidase beta subunit family domain-containing protein n=1 Tax=Micromonospora sp. NPDC049366 TaxID=3364271 RepID=UPI0037A214B3
MAVAKARLGGQWVDSTITERVRYGGQWIDVGPTEQPAQTEFLFSASMEAPDNPNWSEAGTSLTLGTLITPTTNGEILGGRWLFPTVIPTGMVAQFVLYDAVTRAELRRATFTNPTGGAWNTVPITPYPVTAGARLVAAVHIGGGTQIAYPSRHGFFATGRTNGNLTAPASTADPVGNGRFYNGDGFPGDSYNASSYYVDLLFAVPVVSGGSITLVGPDRPVLPGQTVGLDVVATNLAAGETIASYTWSVQSGGGSLTGASTATPTYTAPSGTGVAVVRAAVTTNLGNIGYLDLKVSRGANPVAAENALPGTPRAVWDLPVGALGGVDSLQGFCDGFSADKSETVAFKIGQSDGAGWTASIYRLGWYGGNGARLYANLTPTSGQLAASQSQPAPADADPSTTLLSADCAAWATTLEWTPPAWAPSGMYVLRLDRTGGGASHVLFVLRDDDRVADLMVMPADSTWQAYNAWGGLGSGQYAGNSLYYGTSVYQYNDDAARFISYNRPIINRGACDPGRNYGAVEWSTWFTGEYPMLRFLERNGIDAKWYSCLDAAGDPDGDLLANVNAAMFVGHNEYWSDGMRSGWEAAKAAGTSIFSCAGNEVFWRCVGSAADSDGRPRTWECQKSTIGGRGSDRPEWTGAWRDPAGSGKGGGRPENELTGTIFVVNGPDLRSLVVPQAGGYSATPLWRHTPVAALGVGQSWSSPGQILGFEWDTYGPGGTSSPGAAYLADPHPEAIYCSDATYTIPSGLLLTDAGDEYTSGGTASHRLVVHPGGNGAIAFGTGTVNWALGLDNANVYQQGGDNVSSVIQQATINMLTDMGAPPATLMAGLTMPTPHDWWGGGEPAVRETFPMDTPGAADGADGQNITVATRFSVTAPGSWVGMRVWVTPTAPTITPRIVAYNDDTDARLAVQQYTEPSSRGQYHDVLWASPNAPIPVAPGSTYMAAVHSSRYAATATSGMSLPLLSGSERIYSASGFVSVGLYRYETEPGTVPPATDTSLFFHVAPLIEFDA